MEFKNKIEQINILEQTPLSDYLELSLESDKKYCKGWDYLKTNLTLKLKNILLSEDYNKIIYNSQNVKFILNKLDIQLNDKLKDQLGSFVYVWKSIKRDCEKKEQEDKLKKELLERGFKEVEFLKYKDKETTEEFNKRKEEYYKKLNGLKVKCVFDRDKIGMLGSFTQKGEYIGKLVYNKNNICFLPKRHTKTGQILISKFYYKEIK